MPESVRHQPAPAFPLLDSVSPGNWWAESVVIAFAYVFLARFALRVETVGHFATLMWPPSGLAISVLLGRGPRLTPALWVAAFVVNVWSGATPFVAAGIACGSALEAAAALALLRRVRGFDLSLARVGDVLALALSSLAGAVISATVGVGSLLLAGALDTQIAIDTWRSWWLANVLGAFLTAPLVLTWWSLGFFPRQRLWRHEFLAVLALALLSGLLAWASVGMSRPWLLFPLLLLAAVRFGPRGAASVIAATTGGTIVGLIRHHDDADLRLQLSELQLFTAFTSVTFLVMGALAAESARRLTESSLARAAAEDASLRKTDLLRAVSHELRTPIAALRLQLERMKITRDEDDKTATLARMSVQTRRLHTLIEGLLAHGRIQSGRLTLSPEPIDATQIVVAAADEFMQQAEAAGLNLRCDLPGPVMITTDPQLLRLILANLVGNALKFTDEGSVVIAARADAGCVITVTDTGRGIAPDQLSRVFEPFEQSGGVAHGVPGIGLGLALARDLATALGATLLVESEPGRGSTFRLRLPRERSQPPTAQPSVNTERGAVDG